jgi:hypothetical protein
MTIAYLEILRSIRRMKVIAASNNSQTSESLKKNHVIFTCRVLFRDELHYGDVLCVFNMYTCLKYLYRSRVPSYLY